MSRALTPATRIFQGSNTATTGGTITLSVAAAAGYYNFRDRYANGATGVPLFLSDGTSFEYSVGTFNRGGGDATTDTISSRVISLSSAGVATPIAWGAGARNAQCDVSPLDFLFASNSFAEMSSTQIAAALVNLGIVFGTSAGNVVKLDGSARYPAADGSLITGLPASPIPSGTKLIGFYQAAAPSGWTMITTLDDMMIAVTNGTGITGGGPHAGGTTDSTYGWDNSSGITVGNHTLTVTEIPTQLLAASGSAVVAPAAVGAAPHNHPISSASTFRPPRAFTIAASKN